MKQTSVLFALVATALGMVCTTAFAPQANIANLNQQRGIVGSSLNLFDEQERTSLTRESEPDEFFSTNTDKMTDEEKIPIAIAGLVGISLPFILGLIALYAAKG